MLPHNIDTIVEVFPYGSRQISQYFPNSILGTGDYKTTLRDLDSDNTFFYLDPPHIMKKVIYYPELFTALRSLKGKFMLIHDANQEVETLGKGFTIERLPDESVIRNYSSS